MCDQEDTIEIRPEDLDKIVVCATGGAARAVLNINIIVRSDEEAAALVASLSGTRGTDA